MSMLTNSDSQRRLASWIKQVCGAERVDIKEITQLDGGAIQQNWLVGAILRENDTEQQKEFVLRTDAPATIAESRNREEEFYILQAAYRHGVTVPKPLGYCTDDGILGQAFSLVEKVDGIGFGPKVVKQTALNGNGDDIVRRLAAEMAKIHQLDPERSGLHCVDASPRDHGRAELLGLRQWLDRHQIYRPALEWGLRWAERHLPKQQEAVFLHRDFRTGNFLINNTGLTAILDWEFSGYGDPMSDIGWFCAECWRFSRPDLEAGGLARRSVFYQAYESASGRTIEQDAVQFWELVAHLRWAVIALQQGNRHLSGKEPSLSMAITSRIVDQLELIILRMTAGNSHGQLENDGFRDTSTKLPLQEDSPAPHQSAGADLLAIAGSSLTPAVLDELSSPNRLTALMVKNAIGIVEREHLYADEKNEAERALIQYGNWSSETELANLIRSGELDHDKGVAVRLARLVAIRSEIFKPGFASQAELTGAKGNPID